MFAQEVKSMRPSMGRGLGGVTGHERSNELAHRRFIEELS